MLPKNLPDQVGACPSSDQLAAFSAGTLADSAWDEVASHVSGCRRCEAALQALPQSAERLLTALRDMDRPEAGLRGDPPGDGEASPSWLTELVERPVPAASPEPLQLREYRLFERLGRGGMGTVYRALHTRLDRVVAVKVLAPGRVSDPDAVARFRREMRAVGKLRHDNIVQAHDAGEEGGSHFLVMEFLDGSDLGQLAQRHGQLPPADACEIIRQAALGLQHAHDHGLVHRDVKPSNLVLTPAGQVKVLDLGLARLQGVKAAGEQSTASGYVMGSFDYIAPEQGDNPHTVDHRADLYSLGCTLYHLLAGQPPFPSPRYATPLQKLTAHTQAPVPPVRAARPDVPEGLARVVHRLLAKQPADRVATAADAAAALKPFTAGHDLPRLLRPRSETAGAAGIDPGATDCVAPGADTRGSGSGATPSAGRRRPWLLAAAGLIAAAALGVAVYRISTDDGTVEVVTDDPAVKVIVEQGGKQILLIDPASKQEVRLRTGKYLVKLGEGGKGLKLEDDTFTLTRGGKAIVTVRRLPVVLIPGGGERPAALREEWFKEVTGLPAEKQWPEVARELQRLNPGFDGTGRPTIDGNAVTGLEFRTDHVTNVSPVRALVHLRKLFCRGTEPRKGKLADLGPLRGLELTYLDCSLNAVADLTALKGMPLAHLNCTWCPVADLTPLQAMPLEALHLPVTSVTDLTALARLPLKELYVPDTKVKDLAPLKAVRTLLVLSCTSTEVSDLEPLRDMQLIFLDCNFTRITDLAPLKGQPLDVLRFARSGVTDLTPLRGMTKLEHLQCFRTAVSDIGPLAGLPLNHLDIGDTDVNNLTPLRGMKTLKLLVCARTKITDLAPLKGLALRELVCTLNLPRDAAVLRSLPHLEVVNGKPAADVLKGAGKGGDEKEQ